MGIEGGILVQAVKVKCKSIRLAALVNLDRGSEWMNELPSDSEVSPRTALGLFTV
jgi:hypothetical protein